MTPSSEPAWTKNNFLNSHISLAVFTVIAIIAIIVYCIILSFGCAALRKRQNGETKLAGDGQELAVMTAFLTGDQRWEGSGGITVPARARTRVRNGLKGVVPRIRDMARR